MSEHGEAFEPRYQWEPLQRMVPDVVAGLRQISASIDASGLDQALIELVKIRASQINGCAYCVQFHVNKARSLAVRLAKLDQIAAWRDSPAFAPAERAALAWTEALTRMAQEHVGDEVWQLARRHFDDAALANLTAAIALINAWNRLMGALRVPPPPPATAPHPAG